MMRPKDDPAEPKRERVTPEASDHTELRRIQDAIAKLPVLDERSEDELIGYDESGLPA
jgi:hypothetical protein